MGRRSLINPLDAMFLWGESAETTMHVASLMPFTPPAGADPSYLRDLVEEMRAAPVARPWNLRLAHPHLLRHPAQAWVEDDDVDLDYHVRRSALPSPGDERELGVIVSRLHSHQLDFTRPPWEVHVIEGLEGGRFALYIKVHHSLVDGFTATRIQSRCLASDPADRVTPFFFEVDPRGPRPARETTSARPLAARLVRSATTPVRLASRTAAALTTTGLGTAKAVTKLEFARGERRRALVDPVSAPNAIFNARTGRNRRLATQSCDLSTIRDIAHAAGGTVNDVVMAMCGGALRRYLDELGALPGKPLIAFMPVNIRADGDEGGGNRVGVLLASMGTHLDDPVERLESVVASTAEAKQQMRGMRQLTVLAYSGYLMAPAMVQVLGAMADLSAGLRHALPTNFNLCVSNLPGPERTLYLRGSRLEAIYPMSIPVHGMALNITLESYDGHLDFGFVGCRDAVPSLQRLAVYTGEALAELAKAYEVV